VKGIFITFEGNGRRRQIDQIEILAARLRQLGRMVRVLSEREARPLARRFVTRSSTASQPRDDGRGELLLMKRQPARSWSANHPPRLAAGETVLCDRFHDSTTAYQGHGASSIWSGSKPSSTSPWNTPGLT